MRERPGPPAGLILWPILVVPGPFASPGGDESITKQSYARKTEKTQKKKDPRVPPSIPGNHENHGFIAIKLMFS